MNIQPLVTNILVKSLEPEKVTAGGILIPDTAEEKPEMGKVLAVGEKVSFVKVGNTVMYKKWGGNEVKLDGEELMLILEEDILAIVT